VKPSKLTNFYVRSGLFGILSLTGAFFNYALYPVLVRILSARDFGDFAVIVAISNQVLGILLAFNIISIYLVKAHEEEKARNHAQVIQKFLIWLFLGATVTILVASPYLHNLLQVQNISSFIILALILLTAIPGIIWTGYLQGNKELVRVGGFNLSAALAKLIFATLLAMVFGSNGGLLGILCGTLVGLLVLWLVPGVKLPSLGSLFAKSDPEEKKFVLGLKNYVLMCLFVVGVLSFLQNYDIILAKALFKPAVAGIYSGISILSNALYYVCFLLIWIILPEIKINDRANNLRLLATGYKLLAVLTVGALSVEFVLRHFLARLLLGSGFANQGNLLIFATLYQLTLVAITLYAYYLLVNRQRRGALLVVAVLASCGAIPLLFVSTPLAMIRLLWVSLLAGFGVYWLLLRMNRLAKA
jgi:O-antigen/teichoic acid export membrane protein